jgi:hypothetical protein
VAGGWWLRRRRLCPNKRANPQTRKRIDKYFFFG